MNTQTKEPIAMIGIGCRFPGHAANPKKFWDMLCKGVDAIIDVPKDRWDCRRFYDPHGSAAGKMHVKKGGFLKEKWEDFDAEFFHISPREANFVDPQQRLLLELAWEAMEDGGILPKEIEHTSAGVFIGAFTTDWQTLHNSPYNRAHCGIYTGINSSKTILSARLSHFFDLKGPCLTIDTACSSSLAAVHLACQSLWQNECNLALAGGVNAMIIPETTIAMSKGQFLNPDGKCRAFDADARGYVRGEGGGIVILKRLSDAIKDNDPVYAVIRGVGINHDGFTQGIAKPNPDAQMDLIEKVLRESGIDPAGIHYVEAHGTGTFVGDPIEAMALNQVLACKETRGHPCFLGAVKSNIGHLEAAAGIAGLIKTALCLKHKKIPPNLHFQTPNPTIPFEQYCLKVPVGVEDFPDSENPIHACVNSFGYGGTNAHAVLQNYEQQVDQNIESISSRPFIFPFSAKTGDALKDMAADFFNFFSENPDVSAADAAYTLTEKRTSFEHRLAVSAQSSQELMEKLHHFGKGDLSEGCVEGKALEGNPQLVFVYTGMGPQWWGMGKQLMQFPVFAEAIKQCDEYLLSIAGWSLLEEFKKSEGDSSMDDPVVAQIANYSLQAALTLLLRSWGVGPAAVAGHSIGEVAAAFAAGILSLNEGLLTTYHRSRLQASKKGLGTMLAIGLGKKEALPFLTGYEVSIAAENSSSAVTLAGKYEDLSAIADLLEKNNIYSKFLKVNIAYHSHQMEGLERDLLKALDTLAPKTPAIPFFSTVYGEEITKQPLDAGYWWKNIRNPVLFSKAAQSMINKGYRLFVEIGPHPVLANFIKEELANAQTTGASLATLNRKKTDPISLMECLAGLYVNGFPLSYNQLHPNKGCFARLPAYPWQRKRYWVESEESRQYRLSNNAHPLLSRRVKASLKTWQVEINHLHFPWLEGHQINGTVVFPAAAYVESGFAIFGNMPCILEEVDFHQLLTLSVEKETLLQISLDAETDIFKVHSISDQEEWEWTLHASGKCFPCTLKTPDRIELDALKQGKWIDGQEVYVQFALQGLEYKDSFRGIQKLWKMNRQALAEIHIGNVSENYHLHPALLDSALQTLIGAVDAKEEPGDLILPFRIDQIIFYTQPRDTLFCHAICTKQTSEEIRGDLFLCDGGGNVFAQIKGLHCRLMRNSDRKNSRILYQTVWEEKPGNPLTDNQENQQWLIGFTNAINSKKMADCLEKQQISCRVFSPLEIPFQQDIFSNEKLNILIGCETRVNEEKLFQSEIHAFEALMQLIKCIEKKNPGASLTLWIITHGTQSVGQGGPVHLEGSTLWGLCRVIRQEHPSIRCRLIDLDPSVEIEMDKILQEGMQNNQEDEIAWRGQKRYVCKLKQKDPESMVQKEQIFLSAGTDAFALDLKTPGLIESLFYRQIEKSSPANGEVSVSINTSSLNFKDLMKVLGMLDQNVLEDTYFGKSFGMECAGTITAIGPKVKNYKIGDKVRCFAPNTFQSHINVSTQFISRISSDILFDESPIYIPFVTVLRALKDLARLKKRETILIHSAAGAVGLAAIQYAHFVGAKVIATVGSEEKKHYLRTLGIENCGDSRSLSFVEDVLKWTEGKGIDVVLNSLSGDALAKSWSLLAPYGRFIEIGKRDISQNTSLAMKCFNRNTTFAAVDLDRTFIEHPGLIKKLLKETDTFFKKKNFLPLPCKIFSAGEVVDAFQHMARSRHIGKIMLKFDQQTVAATPNRKAIASSEHAYIVTGGLSGFGLAVAKWLVEKGAKHLILIGRSGSASLEAQEAVQQLKKIGVNVKVAAVDVSNTSDLANLFAECDKTMPPIKGIVHSAMVLKDTFISEMTSADVRQVLSPKIEGCLSLHRLTLQYQLDFFILFSSVSSLIGNPGQGNYAAANAFLDSFCAYRKSLGYPALTINWGALNTGILARHAKVAKHLESHGIKALDIKTALNMLEKSLQANENHLCVMDINWEKIMQVMPAVASSSVFEDFSVEKIHRTSKTVFLEQLSTMDEIQRSNFIIGMVKEIIGKTLKIEPLKLETDVRLNLLGVDSLMAMELQIMMEKEFGVKIPTLELMKGPTIKYLAQYLQFNAKSAKC